MFDATVIIPTYNRAEPLRHTLESLTRQKVDGRQFEVIVSDDGSSDHTAEVVKGFRDKFPVTYLFQEDRGYRCTLARNQGIRAAKGRVCIFLDGGVVVSDRCLREHLRMYEENQNPVLVMGYVYANHGLKPEVEEQLRQLLLDYDVEEAIDRARELGFKDTRERLYRLYGDQIHQWPAPWLSAYGCNISTRREFATQIGMFDEQFTTWGADDNEFGLRAQLHGAKFLLNRKADGIYYPHKSGNTKDKDPKAFQENLNKNFKYIYDKFPLASVKMSMEIPYYAINRIMLEENIDESGFVMEAGELRKK